MNNKTVHFWLLMIFFWGNCNNLLAQALHPGNKGLNEDTAESSTNQQIKLVAATRLWVAGNFDGHTKGDTLFQHLYAGTTHTEADSIADAGQDWDTWMQWVGNQHFEVYLAFGKAGKDTLHLGYGIGLYCLINIGDINKDGKDEIALVPDRPDYSRVNSCIVYSLCNGKWKRLKDFGIHEGAFDYTGNTRPVFTQIEGYLEKRRESWVYMDCTDNDWDAIQDYGNMKLLTLEKCK